MCMVARLQTLSKKKYPFDREVVIWEFKLLISGNRKHESLCSRGAYSSSQYFATSFKKKKKKSFSLIFIINDIAC